MLTSQVLRTLQFASLGLGCAATSTGLAGSRVAMAAAPQPRAERQVAPSVAISAVVREKLSVAAHTDAPMARRVEAIRALGASHDRTAVVPLLILLENDREAVLAPELRAALEKLDATSALAQDFAAKDSVIRRRAVELSRVWCDRESEAWKAMTSAALRDDDGAVRTAAVSTLGWCRPSDALGALIERLQSDSDSEVRSAAAQALGNFSDPTARSALESAEAKEADEFVQVFIRSALKRWKKDEGNKSEPPNKASTNK